MDQNSNLTQSSTPTTDSIEALTATPTPAPVLAATTTPNTVTSEYREKVYKELAQAMLDGLDKGTITVEQSDEISHFVLDHLDNVGSTADLIVFVKELASKWPAYQSVSLQLQDESQKDEKIKGVQENINQITNQ